MKIFPGPPRSSAPAALAGVVALTGFVAVGCGPEGEGEPRWIDLARGFEPRPMVEVLRSWCEEPWDGLQLRARADEDATAAAWLEVVIPAERWAPDERERVFWIPRPRTGPFLHLPTGAVEVSHGDHAYRRAESGPPQPGDFTLTDDRILVILPLELEEPGDTLLAFHVRTGATEGGSWRVHEAHRAASGIPVWSGHSESVAVSLPEVESTLTVLTAWNGAKDARPPRLRVLVNGEVLLDHAADRAGTSHHLALPATDDEKTVLTFETVEGDGLGIFYQPLIRPTDIGTYANRPWGTSRPNLLLLLADTFRADNMATYGGTGDLTPRLDALAERSIRFLDARSTAAWTLPATSSLFTGLFPGQHGATDKKLSLGPGVTTLAEFLAEAGYRTGAITDASFVSVTFGLDQGFEWFEEHPSVTWDLETTLRKSRAFLERDDGRPVFLLVHSYRTHAPYRPGPSTDSTEWQQLEDQGFEELERLRAAGTPARVARQQVLLSQADPLRRLYRAGVPHLDRGFGELIDDVEAMGLLANGYLLFTSDHGEAFGENGDMLHGQRLWDVKLRVPLLLHGSGLAPRDVEAGASLVDVAPTFAGLAGLAPLPEWPGTDLTELAPGRPGFAFRFEGQPEVAIIDADRKLLAPPDPEALRRGELIGCFDLAADPGEETDLSPAPPEWAAGLALRVATVVEVLIEPLADAKERAADPELDQELEKLGYR